MRTVCLQSVTYYFTVRIIENFSVKMKFFTELLIINIMGVDIVNIM